MFGWLKERSQRSSPRVPSGDLSDASFVATPVTPPPPVPREQAVRGCATWPIPPEELSPAGGLYANAKQIDDHRFVVARAMPIAIGRPATRPSQEVLERLRDAVAKTGTTTVYWFWLSVNQDIPHLGLAVAPNDNAIVDRIGRAVEPIWKAYSPENSIVDILRLGGSSDDAILDQGELLWGSPYDGRLIAR